MARSQGSYIRWQGITITQFGYAINLFLAFATASLGFALSLVKDKDFMSGSWAKCFLDLAVFVFLISLAAGGWCVIARLRDFRMTAQIARDREKWDPQKISKGALDCTLRPRRLETLRLDRTTWKLFYWQTSTLSLGILLLTIAFVVAYHTRLF
jgi:hypothetical protein